MSVPSAYQLRAQLRSRRVAGPPRVVRGGTGPDPELGLAAGAQQPVRPVPREQPVSGLLADGPALGQEVHGEEALGQVVDAAVAVASRDPQDAGLRERLQDRADLVRGAPVPVDRGARLDVGGGEATVPADAVQQLLHERRVLVERAAIVPGAGTIPGQAVERQLRGGQDAEALVVGLEQEPPLVQERVRHLAAVAGNACLEDQVVVAAGDLERVELERPKALEHPQHALLARRQRPRRRQQVAKDKEPTGNRGRDDPRRRRGGLCRGGGRDRRHRRMVVGRARADDACGCGSAKGRAAPCQGRAQSISFASPI